MEMKWGAIERRMMCVRRLSDCMESSYKRLSYRSTAEYQRSEEAENKLQSIKSTPRSIEACSVVTDLPLP